MQKHIPVTLQTMDREEPWSLDSYLQVGGYEAWKKILNGEIYTSTLQIVDRGSVTKRICPVLLLRFRHARA